jgi:hypothetical protein
VFWFLYRGWERCLVKSGTGFWGGNRTPRVGGIRAATRLHTYHKEGEIGGFSRLQVKGQLGLHASFHDYHISYRQT